MTRASIALSGASGVAAIATLGLLVAPWVACAQQPPDTTTFAIVDVTLISPERRAALPHAHVLIRDGRIAEVSQKAFEGIRQIDGRGRYLIPGLIDTHVHPGSVPGMTASQLEAFPSVRDASMIQAPRSYLYHGFTTVLWLGADAPEVQRWNALPQRPDAYFCGKTPLAGGYSFAGFDKNPYFLFLPEQRSIIPASIDLKEHTPEAVVARMAADGAICVKAYYESGFGADRGRLPVPDLALMRRLVAAAHARGLPVFLHANTTAAQAFAVDAGVDVIAHGNFDIAPAGRGQLMPAVEQTLEKVVQRGLGYQPTMQVVQAQAELQDPEYLSRAGLANVYAPIQLAWYGSEQGQWFRRELMGVRLQLDAFRRSVAYLSRLNARLLFGTDTPSMPTYANPPGLNGFYEMRQWVSAGVSLPQLFRAMTIDNARAIKMDRDIGTIQPGKRAIGEYFCMKPAGRSNMCIFMTQTWLCAGGMTKIAADGATPAAGPGRRPERCSPSRRILVAFRCRHSPPPPAPALRWKR